MTELSSSSAAAVASPWMTVPEAKTYARVGKHQIYQACRTKKLKARQQTEPHGVWIIHRDDLDAWLRGETSEQPIRRRSSKKKPSPAVTDDGFTAIPKQGI
ncbi:helix-turn-helix domain-containing protein [Rhodococcus sp. DSM 6344]|nr:helix-turn-helix domain-containing protein [Rhodococcus erythropolis]